MMNPAEASLSPVISISLSMNFMAKWLAEARMISDMIRVSSGMISSSIVIALQLICVGRDMLCADAQNQPYA